MNAYIIHSKTTDVRAGQGAEWEWAGKSVIITRWTPGARRDTPGFIGLGTLQGPHYSVYICPAMDTQNAYTDTQVAAPSNGILSRRRPLIHWCFYGNRTTNTACVWDADLSHSGEVCNPAFLLLSLSVAQWRQRKVHGCHYWQDTGITKTCLWTEEHLWILVIDNMTKMFRVQTRQRSFCSCCCADLFPWASVNSPVINMTANSPSHPLFMSFFFSVVNVFTILLQPCKCDHPVTMTDHNLAM